jgi:hypothetical protein
VNIATNDHPTPPSIDMDVSDTLGALVDALGPQGTVVLLSLGALLLLRSKTLRKGLGKALSAALHKAGRALVRYVRISLWAARMRMPVRLAYRLQPERWREMTAARKLTGLKRGKVRRTAAGLSVRVTLGGSLDLATIQARVDQLETGLGVKRKSIRIEGTDRADRAIVHIVLRNPLRKPILWAGHAPGTVTEPAEVATTPHGDRVSVELLRRWLIAGTTGSGKSLFARLMLAAVATSPDGRLTYADPKRVEAEQWRHLAEVATEPETIGAAISAFRRRMDDRLRLMASRSQTTHQPTAAEPAEVLFVDEAADVVRTITEEQLADLAAIAEQGRAPRFVLWIAVQDPRGDNLPRGIVTQLQAVAGLKLRDSTEAAVVFGRTARKDGWTPERLPGGGGWVLIRDDEHDEPEPARGDLLDEKTLAGLSAPHAPQIRRVVEEAVTVPAPRVDLTKAPAVEPRPADVDQAEDVDLVRVALEEAGADGMSAAAVQARTGLGKTQTYDRLAALVESGDAVKPRHGRYALRAAVEEVAA